MLEISFVVYSVFFLVMKVSCQTQNIHVKITSCFSVFTSLYSVTLALMTCVKVKAFEKHWKKEKILAVFSSFPQGF